MCEAMPLIDQALQAPGGIVRRPVTLTHFAEQSGPCAAQVCVLAQGLDDARIVVVKPPNTRRKPACRCEML